jgi:hypothetical protein
MVCATTRVQVILQIHGKSVAIHVFSRASEEWREFRRNLANRLEITSRIDFGVPLGPSSSAARG